MMSVPLEKAYNAIRRRLTICTIATCIAHEKQWDLSFILMFRSAIILTSSWWGPQQLPVLTLDVMLIRYLTSYKKFLKATNCSTENIVRRHAGTLHKLSESRRQSNWHDIEHAVMLTDKTQLHYYNITS